MRDDRRTSNKGLRKTLIFDLSPRTKQSTKKFSNLVDLGDLPLKGP